MFHRTWGLLFIQANIAAPCTCLDFPSLARFTEEIRTCHYDIVGIGSIISNIGKVRKMCELVRNTCRRATIVVGGHIANIPNLSERIDADHVVHGRGSTLVSGAFGRRRGSADTAPVVVERVKPAGDGGLVAISVDNTAASAYSLSWLPHRMQLLLDVAHGSGGRGIS